MPAQADGTCGNLHRLQIGAMLDLGAVKCCGPVAQPSVSLLQSDDIGVERRDHVKRAARAAAPIQPDTFADIVRGDP